MNLDLTSSSSSTQKSITQKKSYKPRKSNTKNTRKCNISIHFPPPKASHNLSSKKKKKKAVTNLFLSQKSFELLLHHCKPERSPIPPQQKERCDLRSQFHSLSLSLSHTHSQPSLCGGDFSFLISKP